MADVTVLCYPTAGRIALVEPQERGRDGRARACPLIGVVDADGEGLLTIVGVSSPNLADGTEVIVSIFAPEALYRIKGAVHWRTGDLLTIATDYDVERVQRRRWSRHPLQLGVRLAAIDGADFRDADIAGRTLDVGLGGLRIETVRRLPERATLLAIVALPDGERLVAQTAVVTADFGERGCEYRLAFDHLDEVDVVRLVSLFAQEAVGSRT